MNKDLKMKLVRSLVWTVIIRKIIKYSIYIAPYSQSALWRCTLFLEYFYKKKIKKNIFIHLNKKTVTI